MTTPIEDKELEEAAVVYDATIENISLDMVTNAFKAGARYQAEKMQGEIEELVSTLTNIAKAKPKTKAIDAELRLSIYHAEIKDEAGIALEQYFKSKESK